MTTQPKTNKTQTVAFRLTSDQHQHLKTFANAEGYKTVSQWLQQLIADEIADRLGDDD